VVGNPEPSSDEELVARARPLLQPADAGERRRALDRFERQAGTGRTTNELQTIVAAAHEGRVDALFVGDAPHPFGTFQPDLGRMEVHPASEAGDEDLVDAAIFHTLRTGGHVFAMEDTSLPLGGGLAALLRY